jgi:hypothetical protein
LPDDDTDPIRLRARGEQNPQPPSGETIGSEGPQPRLPTEPCVRVRTRLLT